MTKKTKNKRKTSKTAPLPKSGAQVWIERATDGEKVVFGDNAVAAIGVLWVDGVEKRRVREVSGVGPGYAVYRALLMLSGDD